MRALKNRRGRSQIGHTVGGVHVVEPRGIGTDKFGLIHGEPRRQVHRRGTSRQRRANEHQDIKMISGSFKAEKTDHVVGVVVEVLFGMGRYFEQLTLSACEVMELYC